MTASLYHEPPRRVPIPLPASLTCPADCDLARAVSCALAHERELRHDLRDAERANAIDAEIVRFDLRRAERRTEALLALGKRVAA